MTVQSVRGRGWRGARTLSYCAERDSLDEDCNECEDRGKANQTRAFTKRTVADLYHRKHNAIGMDWRLRVLSLRNDPLPIRTKLNHSLVQEWSIAGVRTPATGNGRNLCKRCGNQNRCIFTCTASALWEKRRPRSVSSPFKSLTGFQT